MIRSASHSSGGNVLGLSAFYHDATAAIFRDGSFVAMAAEERFTRQKHTAVFPRYAADFCFDQAGLTAQDLDAVVFYEQPELKFTRVLASTLAGYPGLCLPFARAMRSWLSDKLWLKNRICRELNVHPNRVHLAPHHVSHACQAFGPSGFSDAAILTIDAVGEWACTSLGVGTRDPQWQVSILESQEYPHSLGLFYSAMSAFLGFRPNDGECSTMALASFGKPKFEREIREILRLSDDAKVIVNQKYFNLLGDRYSLFRAPLFELLGPPRTVSQKLPFDALDDSPPPYADDMQRYADIAASVQLVLEEALLALATRLQKLTGKRRLCFAGGVALNAVANHRLLNESGFDEVFIPPDPGDGGAAYGAAVYGLIASQSPIEDGSLSPYVGQSFDQDDLGPILDHIDPADWSEYVREGVDGIERDQLHFEVIDDEDRLVDVVAGELEAGAIVGWCQGRFEVGPRTLGNRSILCDPRDPNVAKRLRTKVKGRAAFRPYALSVTEEHAPRVLQVDESSLPQLARWMQVSIPVQADAFPKVRAAAHVNGTTRPQICCKQDNPLFHKLLQAYGQRSDYQALLNTSFNEDGQPLVTSQFDALLVFARSDMDILVVNNRLLRKQRR